jgi:ATP-dependent exoDNAse (exonuclease V) beta subunit
VVVDYKTDNFETDQDMEKRKEKYRQQLSYYNQLLEIFTKRKVKGSYLYFLRNNLVENVK